MNWKTILLELPLWILVGASFIGGIYAAYTKLGGVTFAAPIIIFIVIALYIWGRILEKKKEVITEVNYQ